MAAPVFVTDDVPTADQVNTWMVNMNFAYKTADEGVASSSVFQDDNHLTLPVIASATYQAKMVLFATGNTGGGQANIQWRLNGPSGATLQGITLGPATGNANGTTPRIDYVTLGSTEQHAVFSLTIPNPIWFEGILVTGGTAGAFNLQWCQQTGQANPTTVKIGSFLRLARVL